MGWDIIQHGPDEYEWLLHHSAYEACGGEATSLEEAVIAVAHAEWEMMNTNTVHALSPAWLEWQTKKWLAGQPEVEQLIILE